MSNDWAPSFRAARLFRKTSQKGSVYFVGRLGGVRVTLLKSRDTADDGSEIWNLMFAEAPAPREAGDTPARGEPNARPENPPRARPEPSARPAVDTEIPF